MKIKNLLKRFSKEPPLGWAQLNHKKVRFLVASVAIAFADIMIFTMLGFKSSMFGGATNLHKQLRGDLFLVSNRSQLLTDGQTFSRRHLYRAEAVDGVASASPLYLSYRDWVNPWNKKITNVVVIAFDPVRPVIDLPEVDRQLEQIKLPDTILFDRLSQPIFGPVSESFDRGETITTEISGRRIKVGGIFTLGSTIFIEGHIITSDLNYLRLFGADRFDRLKLGILHLEPNADLATVQRNVRASLPKDIQVMTHQELIEFEEEYWANVPGGILFNFGVIMGFTIAVVVVYEVLYADINDHLKEYATLKAMGYSDRNLLIVVFQEAIIMAVFGFIPGLSGSVGIYALLGYLNRIPLPMRADVALQVFVITVLIGLISAAIASKKLRSADPAEVF